MNKLISTPEQFEQVMELVFEYMWWNGAYLILKRMSFNGWYLEEITCIARNEL